MQNQTNLTEHTKQILPKQAYQTKPSQPNSPNQTYKTKCTELNNPTWIFAKDCPLTLVKSRLALGSSGWWFATMPKKAQYTVKMVVACPLVITSKV